MKVSFLFFDSVGVNKNSGTTFPEFPPAGATTDTTPLYYGNDVIVSVGL